MRRRTGPTAEPQEPLLLYGVGATKAGTSWLYRYLHDHPQCHLRTIKELHYFDTFDADARAAQLTAFRGRRRQFERALVAAEEAGQGWKVRNMERRLADFADLIPLIDAPRGADDLAYASYLMEGAGKADVVADITPAYGLLDERMFARMAALSDGARFVYLLRDPVDRLWSHVRMQAHRQRQEGEVFELKARRILNRVLRKGLETHLPARGDYAGSLERLWSAVGRDRVHVGFAEALYAPGGTNDLCRFLGIAPQEPPDRTPANAGPQAPIDPAQAAEARRFLAPQYDWVARNIGALPKEWRAEA